MEECLVTASTTTRLPFTSNLATMKPIFIHGFLAFLFFAALGTPCTVSPPEHLLQPPPLGMEVWSKNWYIGQKTKGYIQKIGNHDGPMTASGFEENRYVSGDEAIQPRKPRKC